MLAIRIRVIGTHRAIKPWNIQTEDRWLILADIIIESNRIFKLNMDISASLINFHFLRLIPVFSIIFL